LFYDLEQPRGIDFAVRIGEMHRANMMKELNLKNQTKLVRYAVTLYWSNKG
jgi:FixJ family two-component response regulator